MPSERPGVSFIVPVYNKAKYLPQVLDAIRDQQGDFAREYVFVNDGSTDDSLQLLEKLTGPWEGGVIYSQSNHGSAHATNQAIARARLPYLKFVDADDLLTADATQGLLEALAGSDACLAYGARIDFADGSEVDLTPAKGWPAARQIHKPLRAALRNSMFNPTQMLARTSCVREVGGCDERIVHSQEYSLTLRLARRWPFVNVEAPVAYRRIDVPGSLGTHAGPQLQRVTLACAHFLADHPDLPPDIRHFACRRAAGRAWKYARRNHGATVASRWFWLNLRSYLPISGGHPAFIERCATVFGPPPQELP